MYTAHIAPGDPHMFNYADAYRQACKWNARLLFAVVLLAFVAGVLALAYYWETEHPRPRYSPTPRAAERVMPYDRRSY